MTDPLYRSALSDTLVRRRGQSDKADFPVAQRMREKLAGREMAWLSRETGIPTSTLSDYGRGKVARADKAVKIARALNTSVEWLFAGLPPAPAPLIDAADADWIMVPVIDLAKIVPEGKPEPDDVVPVRRPWLNTVDSPVSALWLTSLPMSVGDVIRRGETLMVRDAEPDLVDGRFYIFLSDGNPLVRRVALDRGGYTLISAEPQVPAIRLERRNPPHPDEQLVPIARILGRFGLQTL